MKTCSRCDYKCKEDMKFCPKCGSAMRLDESKAVQQTNEEFSDAELLDQSVLKCYPNENEPKGKGDVRSVELLKSKLEGDLTLRERCEIINSFRAPESKQEISAFIKLTSVCFNYSRDKEEVCAWDTKMKEVYQHAKNHFCDDPWLTDLSNIYTEVRIYYHSYKFAHGVVAVIKAIGKAFKWFFIKLKRNELLRIFCIFVLVLLFCMIMYLVTA